MTTYTENHGDVDIIFAGGGAAACVAAGRLAKADPDLKILLIEGGKNNYNDPTVVNPAVYLTHLQPDSKTALVGSVLPQYQHNRRLTGRLFSSTRRRRARILQIAKPSCQWVVCWGEVLASIL